MALLAKELRSVGWAGLAALLWLLGRGVDMGVDFGSQAPQIVGLAAMATQLQLLAVGLGAWLAWSESRGGTWPLLLTRPVRRWQVTGGKLAVGLAVLAAVTLAAAWQVYRHTLGARLEGPFDPALLIAPQRRAMLLVPWFLAAFLCGLPHRAHPVGRWLPLGAMVLLQARIVALPWSQAQVAATVALTSLLLMLAAMTARVEVDTA